MCQVSGCTEPIRVLERGLCQAHYNRWYRYGDPLGGPDEVSECLQCGVPTPKPPVGPRSSYCTRMCRRRAEYQRLKATGYYTERADAQKSANRARISRCQHCDAEMIGARSDAKYCSPKCSRDGQPKGCATVGCEKPLRAKGLCNYCYRKGRGEKPPVWNDARRDAYHRRRALKAGTSNGKPVRLADIRERDGNRCHLCSKKVSARPWPHPLSASLDHVIPLSLDGEHTPENVRLAHLRCNVEKGNGGGNEQLLLIG